MHSQKLTSTDLGKFHGADTILATSKSSTATDPLLSQYAFPEKDIIASDSYTSSHAYLDPGHASAAPRALPYPVSAARPILSSDKVGVSVSASIAPGRTQRSPFIPPTKSTTGEVLWRAAKRWRRWGLHSHCMYACSMFSFGHVSLVLLVGTMPAYTLCKHFVCVLLNLEMSLLHMYGIRTHRICLQIALLRCMCVYIPKLFRIAT